MTKLLLVVVLHFPVVVMTAFQLGVAVMVHGDDKGMVMPPRVAPLQVVIIPIVYKEGAMKDLADRCHTIAGQLTGIGVRVKVDDRVRFLGTKIQSNVLVLCFFFRN